MQYRVIKQITVGKERLSPGQVVDVDIENPKERSRWLNLTRTGEAIPEERVAVVDETPAELPEEEPADVVDEPTEDDTAEEPDSEDEAVADEAESAPTPKGEVTALGGGWYELSNGERVQGKQNAEDQQRELNRA